MKRYFLLVLIGLLLSSCATIKLPKSVKVKVLSNTDSVKICLNNDTSKWYNTPLYLNILRSSKSLSILAKKDSILKQLNIKSKLTVNFLLGNLCFGPFALLGYSIDFTNPRRYTYPSNILIDYDSNNFYIHKNKKIFAASEKHLLTIKTSIPEGNIFYLNKGDAYGNRFGFLGFSVGFDYYFNKKYCLNMDVGTLTDFMIPFPAPMDYNGRYNKTNATYGDIQIGRDYKRWHYDVGFQYTRTSYYVRETAELYPFYIDTLIYSKHQNNLGFALSVYYKVSNIFNLGVNYYPSLIVWDNNRFSTHYSHLIFFELTFKMTAYKPKKKT